MIERSQAEVEADEVMHLIHVWSQQDLPGRVAILNHLYTIHKLRDRALLNQLLNLNDFRFNNEEIDEKEFRLVYRTLDHLHSGIRHQD